MLIFPSRESISAVLDENGSLLISSEPDHLGGPGDVKVIVIDRNDVEYFLLALNDICKGAK